MLDSEDCTADDQMDAMWKLEAKRWCSTTTTVNLGTAESPDEHTYVSFGNAKKVKLGEVDLLGEIWESSFTTGPSARSSAGTGGAVGGRRSTGGSRRGRSGGESGDLQAAGDGKRYASKLDKEINTSEQILLLCRQFVRGAESKDTFDVLPMSTS